MSSTSEKKDFLETNLEIIFIYLTSSLHRLSSLQWYLQQYKGRQTLGEDLPAPKKATTFSILLCNRLLIPGIPEPSFY